MSPMLLGLNATCLSVRQRSLSSAAVRSPLAQTFSDQGHLVDINLVFAAMIEGGPMPERRVDRLGDDPVGPYRSSSASLQAAFSRPECSIEQSYRRPLGSATGAEHLQIRLYDLLAHGWDLAQATGQPADLPDDLAERSLAFARTQLTEQ